MVIHKLLMEMNTEIMIWKCKVATASELRKMVTVYRTHICECASYGASNFHIYMSAPTVESWSHWHVCNQECTMLALTSELFCFT